MQIKRFQSGTFMVHFWYLATITALCIAAYVYVGMTLPYTILGYKQDVLNNAQTSQAVSYKPIPLEMLEK